MNLSLSSHFTCKKLLRLVMPSVFMMIFTSIYGVVDGFFVSNYVGKTSFTAVNFIMPVLMILGSLGFMFGTGGSALIAVTLGEGKPEKARRLFSLIVYASVISGTLLTLLGFVFLRPIAVWLGATGQLLADCVLYGRIILLAIPAFILQYEFQCLFATAQKPGLGLFITIAAGCTNMVLDAWFVAILHWGLAGAATATALSQCVGGVLPLFYFAFPNKSLLRLVKTSFDKGALLKTCVNGSSELMSNISISIVSMLYNGQLLKYAGENGVAAYGVLMYVSMIFQAIYIGYSVGAAPVISYHYGAQNHKELKGLLKRSLLLVGIFSVAMFLASYAMAAPVAGVFVGYDTALLNLTTRAFGIFSFSFLFSGYAIFGSSFFTALNDGPVSAAISFLRTMVFQIAAVLLLPLFWGTDGIWFSIVFAELMAVAVTALFLLGKRKKYHY